MSFPSFIGGLFGAAPTPPPAPLASQPVTGAPTLRPYTPPAAPAPSIQPSPGHALLTSLKGGRASLAETLSSYDRLSPALKANLETRVYNYHHDLNCQDPKFDCRYGEIALTNDIRCLYDVKGSLHPILAATEPSKQQALVTLISLLDSLSTTPSELTAAFKCLDVSIKGPIQGLIYHSHSQKYGPSPENYQFEHGKNAVRANPWILLNKPAGSSKTLLELSLDEMGASAPTSSVAARTIASTPAPAASASSVAPRSAASPRFTVRLINNSGGGDCAPLSVLHQLQQLKRAGRIINNPATGSPFSNQHELRTLASAYLRNIAADPTRIANNLPLVGSIENALRDGGQPHTGSQQELLRRYADYIDKDTNWLDKPFFAAVANKLGLQIAIVRETAGRRDFEIEERFPQGPVTADTLFVHYNGIRTIGGGNHFQTIDRSDADGIGRLITSVNLGHIDYFLQGVADARGDFRTHVEKRNIIRPRLADLEFNYPQGYQGVINLLNVFGFGIRYGDNLTDAQISQIEHLGLTRENILANIR